jgi:hypothetical protein
MRLYADDIRRQALSYQGADNDQIISREEKKSQ